MKDGCLVCPFILVGDRARREGEHRQKSIPMAYTLFTTVLDSFESLDLTDGHLPAPVSVYALAGRV